MPRDAQVRDLFRFCASFFTVSGTVLVVMSGYYRVSKISMKNISIVCAVSVLALIFDRGTIPKMFISLVKWVLQHLHTTEDHRWVIGLGISGLCDFVLVAVEKTPFIVLWAVSMIMICIVAAGWDSDRSGMTEGLLVGYFKLLLFNAYWGQTLSSLLCSTVLFLAIASKLTESATEARNLNVTSAESTRRSAEI